MTATSNIPGAKNITAAQLSSDMIVALGIPSPQVAQTTLSALAAYFAGGTGALAITAISTVGAGSLTAAAIVGGIVTRSGSQTNTAFTDTTVAASAIIAAMPDPDVGEVFIWRYVNNTNAPATLAGGSGVTLSATVPANSTATFAIKYTAANTLVATILGKTPPSTTSGTFTCNGVTPVTVADTNVTANSNIVVTLKTVGGTVGAIPAIKTITAGTGFTIAGTASDTSTYQYLILN